jgi:hypothetical protein
MLKGGHVNRTTTSWLRRGYRSDARTGSAEDRLLEQHLAAAGDALNIALLCLDGSTDESRAAKLARIFHARHLLVEATTELARARVHVPDIRTYALPVVMNAEADVDAELRRLHQLTTRLCWYNHEHLPQKTVAAPLSDEDERQLAEVVRGLGSSARFESLVRHKWFVAALLSLCFFPLLGPVVCVATLAFAALAIVTMARGTTPALAPG